VAHVVLLASVAIWAVLRWAEVVFQLQLFILIVANELFAVLAICAALCWAVVIVRVQILGNILLAGYGCSLRGSTYAFFLCLTVTALASFCVGFPTLSDANRHVIRFCDFDGLYLLGIEASAAVFGTRLVMR